jgi:hypothetical protein
MTPDLLTSALRQTRLWDLVPVEPDADAPDECDMAIEPPGNDRDTPPTAARTTQPTPEARGREEIAQKQERQPLALVPSEVDGNGGRRRAPKRAQVVAARCVGSVQLRPMDSGTTEAIAETLANAKRRQLRAGLVTTVVSADGSGRSAGRAGR